MIDHFDRKFWRISRSALEARTVLVRRSIYLRVAPVIVFIGRTFLLVTSRIFSLWWPNLSWVCRLYNIRNKEQSSVAWMEIRHHSSLIFKTKTTPKHIPKAYSCLNCCRHREFCIVDLAHLPLCPFWAACLSACPPPSVTYILRTLYE